MLGQTCFVLNEPCKTTCACSDCPLTPKEKTVKLSDLEEMKADMCDHYCKWPNILDEDQLLSICQGCPLDKF